MPISSKKWLNVLIVILSGVVGFLLGVIL